MIHHDSLTDAISMILIKSPFLSNVKMIPVSLQPLHAGGREWEGQGMCVGFVSLISEASDTHGSHEEESN
jgi:hypothetical protein